MSPASTLYLLLIVLMTPSAKAGESSPTPAALTSPSVSPAVPVEAPLNDSEIKKLRAEFKKAIREEGKAFEHQERSTMKELQAAQNARFKEWKDKEKKARHAFFNEHSTGPEQRHYVLDYRERRKQFEKSLVEEVNASRQLWKDKKDALHLSQKTREGKFESALKEHRRPEADLWKQP
jgi:hypothetical protein